jgi:hypothetical protein
MKFSRDDLKQLIQQEISGLNEQMGGALDTRPVQQDVAVKDILEKIRRLNQTELSQLIQALGELGVIPPPAA